MHVLKVKSYSALCSLVIAAVASSVSEAAAADADAGAPVHPVETQPGPQRIAPATTDFSEKTATSPVVQPSAKSRTKNLRRGGKQQAMVQASAVAQAQGIKPAHIEDSPHGYFLTPIELQRINTVECLKLKIQDPFVNCTIENVGYLSDYDMNPANYPSWKDPTCHSGGEFFCDPDRLLTEPERVQLTELLKKLRSGTTVLCSDRDPVDRWHYQPFYLGVALAKNWPMHLSDSETLQLFGRMLANRWNMSFPWDGAPLPFSRCANEGMLIVLPERKQVVLSTPSCEFLCASRGGPEIVTAASAALSRYGLAAAVEAGLKQAYKIVNETTPTTKQLVPSPQLDNWWEKGTNIRIPTGGSPSAKQDWQLIAWNWMFRAIYGVSVFIMAASLVVAILVCLLAPGLISKISKNQV